MNRIAIIHFNVIEFYPPAMNFLDILSNRTIDNDKVILITNKTNRISFKYENKKIKVLRIISLDKNNKRIFRFIKYIYFNFITTIRLFFFRPSKVFYYESHSSLPAYIYKKYISKHSDIIVHYHEYMSEEEYKNGMLLVNFYHQFEKKIYNDVKWISLTNKILVNKFLIDNAEIEAKKVHTLPNFPPRSWTINSIQKDSIKKPVKIVYVGSLSNATMFYEEFANWVLKLNGEASWDIYSQQISNDVLRHIQQNGNGIINFNGFVNYYQLSEVLSHYDVGLILYRGHIQNFIYNATNKLFEYLACGLDVWFPEELLGAYDYITNGTYPKVIKIDFKNLEKYDLDNLISREGLTYKPSTYFAEDIYEPFIENYILK